MHSYNTNQLHDFVSKWVMHFYFDESGDFSPPSSMGEHKSAVVVGVDIPEVAEAGVFASFNNFVNSLSSNELDRGEPKGRLLTDENRKQFCEAIAAQEPLIVTPTLLDLTTLADGAGNKSKESLIAKLQSIAPECKYESMANELRLLARQIANLSLQQNLRLVALAHCIFQSVKNCVLFHSASEYDSCWDDLVIDIDPVQPRPGSREQIVFEKIMLGWMTAWSKQDPIVIIEEIHTEDHPFIRNYAAGTGIDLGALLRDRIRWPSSSSSPGLQIADMCATVNSLVVRRIVNAQHLHDYGVLMKRSCLGPLDAPGLLTIADCDVDVGSRYAGLTQAIEQARQP